MKRFGIMVSSVLLSALILLGSGRFTIGKMLCPSGKTTYSLGNAKNCCEKKNDAAQFKKPSCCSLINVAYSLNDFNPSEKVKVSAQESDLFFTSLICISHSSFIIRHSSFSSRLTFHAQ